MSDIILDLCNWGHVCYTCRQPWWAHLIPRRDCKKPLGPIFYGTQVAEQPRT